MGHALTDRMQVDESPTSESLSANPPWRALDPFCATDSHSALDATGARVLVVDDEPMIGRILHRILKREGFVVTNADCGQDALAKLAGRNFDLVISDISMPGGDGLSLMDAMRRRRIDLPVILVTGVPSTESAIEAVRLGAVGYLGKPIHKDHLLGEVRRALRLSAIARLRREALDIMMREGRELSGEDVRRAQHQRLDRAIDGLYMVYQPIVSWTDNRVVGYEALARSREPGLTEPGALFETAENLGRVEQLGRCIHLRSAEPFVEDRQSTLFLNLHAQDLADEALCDVNNPLAQMADRVVLEVTERAQLEQLRDMESQIARLREMGFRIAIDDIGAGYAGLSSFALLEPDLVKLDKTLVRGVERTPVKHKLIESLAALCADLHILVVAEGVETKAERDTLLELGCDLFQGYLFSHPTTSLAAPIPCEAG